jgi:hypothetical protein
MKTFTILTALIGALAIPAVAQDVNDGPGPGVARLSLAEGDVVIRRGDSGEFVAAETNAPLVALDHVLTGSDGRAEIQFDYANRIRLAADSEVRMAALEDGDFFIQIPVGTATFSVLEGTEALVEISTPTVSVRPREAGSYRIDVGPDGATEVTVRSGEAELFTALQTEILGAGRTLEIRGDPAAPELIVLNPRPIDDWDRWNAARDSDLRDDDVYRYVSRDIYGAEDLRGHGRWVYDSPYGWVWVPNASPTWAPYRVGRWTWIDYYGWTWVSGDPWGWAPYHYGRWYYASRLGWVWHPGTRLTRHYWRPALVTFFGWGSGGLRVNVSLNIGYRNVGWVPLAPYEVYRPWYGRYPRTNVDVNINNVTVINNVNIVNTYRNARFVDGRNAVTSVPAPDFGRNRVSVNNFVRVSDRDLDGAGEVRGRVPLDPGAAGRRFSDRTVDARSVRETALDPGLLPRRDGRPPRNAVAEAPATPGRGNGRGAALDDTGAGRGASRNAAAQDAPSGVSPARGVNGPGRAEEPQAGRAARGAAPEERGRGAASAP